MKLYQDCEEDLRLWSDAVSDRIYIEGVYGIQAKGALKGALKLSVYVPV